MKTSILRSLAIPLIVAAAFLMTSCIYDAPGDKFYRTLWRAQDNILGEITVEFLCDNKISVKSDTSPFDSYGTYESSRMQAVFQNLTLVYDELIVHSEYEGLLTLTDPTVTIREAHRDGDTLYLHWTVGTSDDASITVMHRLSEYD